MQFSKRALSSFGKQFLRTHQSQYAKYCHFGNKLRLIPLQWYKQQWELHIPHSAHHPDTMDNTIHPRQHLAATAVFYAQKKCHKIANEAECSTWKQQEPKAQKNPTSETCGNSKSRPPNMIRLSDLRRGCRRFSTTQSGTLLKSSEPLLTSAQVALPMTPREEPSSY